MPRAAASGGPKKGRPGPKANKLAEEFPSGMVLQDLCKKQWHLGNVIGQGGFGLIYLASEDIAKPVDRKTAGYVIKIEPKDNGPLYCEMQFYQRVAKLGAIENFISTHRLRYLGIPPYIATGRHDYKSQEFRFLTMPRFGQDLQKVLVDCGGRFQPQTVFAIALRMVDALQFLHENEYVHADIKASNILLGFAKGMEISNEVYLVDYGLAYRYTVDGVHKEYKQDPRKAHDGTIEFTSRDAHLGLSPSRRGDFEILGYCMLQWLSGRLPWEDDLNNPNYVAQSKEKFMTSIPSLVGTCLTDGPNFCSECMSQYLKIVKDLKYDSAPDYRRIRDILRVAMNKAGQKDEWKLDFSEKSKGKKRKSADLEMSMESPAAKKGRSPAKQAKSPAAAKAAKSPAKAKAAKYSAKAKIAKSPAKQEKLAGIKHAVPKKSTPASKMVKPLEASKAKVAVPPKSLKASAAAKTKIAAKKSPSLRGRSRKSPAARPGMKRTPMTNTNGAARGIKPLKLTRAVISPAKITPLTPAGSAAHKKATKRKVKRVTVIKSDASNQTSPGLDMNR